MWTIVNKNGCCQRKCILMNTATKHNVTDTIHGPIKNINIFYSVAQPKCAKYTFQEFTFLDIKAFVKQPLCTNLIIASHDGIIVISSKQAVRLPCSKLLPQLFNEQLIFFVEHQFDVLCSTVLFPRKKSIKLSRWIVPKTL